MKITFFLFCAVLISIFSFSQSSYPGKYKNISFSFPSKFDSTERKGLQVYYVNKDSLSFQVLVHKDQIFDIKNQDDYDHYSKLLVTVFLSRATGDQFKQETRDSVIGGIKGKYVHLYEPVVPNAFKESFAFMTIMGGRSFTIQVLALNDMNNNSRKKVEEFFRSIKFEGQLF